MVYECVGLFEHDTIENGTPKKQQITEIANKNLLQWKARNDKTTILSDKNMLYVYV